VVKNDSKGCKKPKTIQILEIDPFLHVIIPVPDF
jgi:hypothetical protein